MFIEQEALKYWIKGSYEWQRKETIRAIKEANEIDFKWKLVATYSNHALIVSDKGDFFRCFIEEFDFRRKFLSIEKIQGPKVYTEDDKVSYYEKKTQDAVSSILEGKEVDLSTLIIQEDFLDCNKAVISELQSIIDDRNLWSSYYNENEYRIERATWQLENRMPHIKEPDQLKRAVHLTAARAHNAKRCDDKFLVKVVESISEDCANLEYWLSKLSTESKLPSAYGATLEGLVECLGKMDMIITYAEGLRRRR